jgi:cell division protein FtsW (lipid II flippase)
MTGDGQTFFGWTVPSVVELIFYAVMFIGIASFMVVTSRKRALSARREPFRKPALIRAAGLLLFAAAGILVFTMDNGTATAPAWAVLLQVGLLLAALVVAFIGGRAYLRAGDAYPPGKHADPHSPPERRRLLR